MLDNIAVASGINGYTPAAGLEAIEYRFTDVLVKQAYSWRVVAARMRRETAGAI
ncbi:hypothetical protein AB4Y43_05775 [Paraburkholderia sp. BR10872]|uniref:hypothetical protein n=1 Tax=Paraburkholderia sp. BR10872 TaxID=3236989 RepID=UPI0034D3482C